MNTKETKKVQYLVLSCLCLLFIGNGCTKLPDDCSRFEGWKIIKEKDKEEVCNFQQIYQLDGEYYSICECCTCDKDEIVIDCNGDVFCKFRDGCLAEFYENAVYLYSAVEED